MTPEQVTRAASALARDSEGLSPPPILDVLDGLAFDLRDRLADLWTLRDAIDAQLAGVTHAAAVSELAAMARGLAEALDGACGLASGLDRRLLADCGGPPW